MKGFWLILLEIVLAVTLSAAELDDLKKGAQAGEAASQYNLGVAFYEGTGVPKDFTEARKWFQLAAAQDLAPAVFNLAHMVYVGEGGPKDLVKAISLFAQAAELGHVDGQTVLGMAYAKGEGVEKSPEKAAQWFDRAARRGGRTAQFNLGNAYHEGTGLPVNLARAAFWWERAATAGDSRAESNLLNPTSWKEAASRGDATAQSWYGSCLYQSDKAEAIRWWTKAADQKEPGALYLMSLAYWRGDGVGKSEAKARDLLRAASDAGYPEALYNLGQMLVEGSGLPMNPSEGYRLLRKAADRGESRAQYNLALGYGNGVPPVLDRDLVQAYVWFALSVRNNPDPESQETDRKVLEQLAEALTQDELDEAEQQVADWRTTWPDFL